MPRLRWSGRSPFRRRAPVTAQWRLVAGVNIGNNLAGRSEPLGNRVAPRPSLPTSPRRSITVQATHAKQTAAEDRTATRQYRCRQLVHHGCQGRSAIGWQCRATWIITRRVIPTRMNVAHSRDEICQHRRWPPADAAIAADDQKPYRYYACAGGQDSAFDCEGARHCRRAAHFVVS